MALKESNIHESTDFSNIEFLKNLLFYGFKFIKDDEEDIIKAEYYNYIRV